MRWISSQHSTVLRAFWVAALLAAHFAAWRCDTAVPGPARQVVRALDGNRVELRFARPAETFRVRLPFAIPPSALATGDAGKTRGLAVESDSSLLARSEVSLVVPASTLKAAGWLEYRGSWIAAGDLGAPLDVPPADGTVSVLTSEDVRSEGRLVFLDDGAQVAFAANREALERCGLEVFVDGAPLYLASGVELERSRIFRETFTPGSNFLAVPAVDRPSRAFQRRFALRILGEDDRCKDPTASSGVRWLRVLREVERVLPADSAQTDVSCEPYADRAARALAYSHVGREELDQWAQGGAELSQVALLHALVPAFVNAPDLELAFGDLEQNTAVRRELVGRLWAAVENAMEQRAICSEWPGLPPGFDLRLFGNVRGVLEECGCKGSAAGGLARMVQFARRDPAGLIGGGNYFGDPGTHRSRDEDADRVVQLLRQLPESVPLAIGELDLLAMARRPSLAASFPWSRCVTLNLQPRDPVAAHTGRPQVAFLSVGEARCVVLGLVGIEATWLSTAHRERILDQFVLADPRKAFEQVRESLAEADQVVVLDSGVPQDVMREIAAGLDRPLLVVDLDVRAPYRLDGHWTSAFRSGSIGAVHWVGHGAESFGWTRILGGGEVEQPVFLDFLEEPLTDEDLMEVVFDPRLGDPEVDAVLEFFPEPRAEFVGSQRCQSCHEEEHAQWAATSHAAAIQSLKEIQRYRQETCVQCHVTGFRQAGGYVPYEREGHLQGVGCEVCHGPGANHVAAPTRAPLLASPPAKLCEVCHSAEHSVFTFGHQADFRRRIAH